MNSIMKFKATAISIVPVLTFAMLSLFGITPSGSAASEILNFPAGANKSVTKTFQAPRGMGVLTSVVLKNDGGSGGNQVKTLTVKLFKPGELQFDAREESISPGQTKSVTFSSRYAGGDYCGDWRVEVSNPNDRAHNVTATITINFNFVPLPIIHTETPFSVSQTQTVHKEVNVSTSGDLVITSTWEAYPPDLSLTFRLKKGNTTTIAGSDDGDNNHLKLKYRVTQQDIHTYGTRWTLEVKGSSRGIAIKVKPTEVLTPGCY